MSILDRFYFTCYTNLSTFCLSCSTLSGLLSLR
nr:MAG TPA: hypothetical protein [Crassvirales sp.]